MNRTSSEQHLRNELAPGERPLWSGQPPTGLRLTFTLVVVVLFALIWTGLVLNGTHYIITKRAWSDALVPAVMTLCGAAVLAWVTFFEPRTRRNTHYALTDRRAIILAG